VWKDGRCGLILTLRKDEVYKIPQEKKTKQLKEFSILGGN
jgi:hypothetical protein